MSSQQVSRFGIVRRGAGWAVSPSTGSIPRLTKQLTQALDSRHGSRAASKPHSFFATATMKLFGLLSLVAATLGMNLKEPVVNEVIDMVESGLGESKEGRALFITLTLTESTWSAVNSSFSLSSKP